MQRNLKPARALPPLTWIALIYLLAALPGCRQSNTAQARFESDAASPLDLIAVIDLNVVAQEIGARDKINFALQQRENELIDELDQLKSDLNQQRQSIQAEYGQDLNQQQQSELDRLLTEHQQKIGLQVQAAQSQLVTQQAQLKVKLLAEIRPVAYQIAQENGMQIVLTSSQVYVAGPNVDITQQVIQRIKQINAGSDSTSRSEPPTMRVAEMPGGGDFMPR